VKDDGVLCELVKVRDGWQKNVGGGGGGNELAGADGSEGREERVGVMPHGLDLWNRVGALSNKAVVLATSIALEVGGESRVYGKGGLDGDDEVAGKVCDPCDCTELASDLDDI
jgi:hypothetical protein